MNDPMIASIFEQDLIQLLNRELIAGNDGLQTNLLPFAVFGKGSCEFQEAFRPCPRKAIGINEISFSLVGTLPLLGIWGGIRLGVCWIELGEPGGLNTIMFSGLEVMLTISIALFAYYLVEVPTSWLHVQTEKTESKFDDMMVPIVRKSLRVTVVLFTLVSIAQSLSDKPVSALLAGLGLGGLAFALAAQDTIKNLFGSMVIFTDKPFGLGDRINYDGHDGVIEEVGLRSTRLRRLDGHQVTIPNGELANKSIHNISKRPFIRRIFTLGVTYDTTHEKVIRAKKILEDILKDHEGMDPKGEMLPRVYFSDFSSSSLDFKCMYWYHPAAYWDYMNFRMGEP